MKKSRVSKLTEYWIEPSRSVKLLAVLSVFCMVFYLASCKKDKENPLEPGYTKPLYLGGGGTQATGLDLSYDVAIQRTVSFQNGLTNASPAWKKLQSVPQTESYSLQVNIGNGNFYLLQDNIEVRSEIRDRVPVEEKIAKIEITGGVSTAYNASGHVISSKSIGNLSQGFLEGVDVQFNNAPIDTDTLAAHGIQYSVNGNSVTIVNSIANGDTANNVSTFVTT